MSAIRRSHYHAWPVEATAIAVAISRHSGESRNDGVFGKIRKKSLQLFRKLGYTDQIKATGFAGISCAVSAWRTLFREGGI